MLKFIYDLDKEHIYRDCITVGNTGRYVVVDSRQTHDAGYETMVFESTAKGDIFTYVDLDVNRYETWEDMKEGHEKMCEKWKKKEDLKCIWEEIFGSSDK